MFFSKIWFFLVALVAAIAITIALVMPLPAARAVVAEEQHRLVVACGVVGILLGDDARNRVDLAGAFSRTPEIVSALEAASGVERLDDARMKQVRSVGEGVMKAINPGEGSRRPDFALLIDRRGRVVARIGIEEKEFGDVAAGRPLVDDALAGYLRDDLWVHNGTMYFVSAAPVIKRDPPVAYAGAVVLGHSVTTALAQRLVRSLDVDLGFYLGKDDIAGTRTIPVEQAKLLATVKNLPDSERGMDCRDNKSIEVTTGKEDYTALVARLPGEAGAQDAYYTVFIKRAVARGFAGTLKIVNQSDLGFGSFPWILVGGGFLVILGIGIMLMMFEADRPLRRLAADTVRLAKGEAERLGEDQHPGKFGSIARSVNIHIDKLGREAKTAKQDLDQLLGPAPEGSLGTIDLLATALPSVRPGGAVSAASPPPSEFKFGGPTPTPTPPPKPPSSRPGTPPPHKPVARPTPPAALPVVAAPVDDPAPPLSLDDDILGAPAPDLGDDEGGDPYYREVYDQFVAMKQSCNESMVGLTYPKFADKLAKNRDDLVTKTGCKDVRFTVYVKEGKAALKATPVKDEA